MGINRVSVAVIGVINLLAKSLRPSKYIPLYNSSIARREEMVGQKFLDLRP